MKKTIFYIIIVLALIITIFAQTNIYATDEELKGYEITNDTNVIENSLLKQEKIQTVEGTIENDTKQSLLKSNSQANNYGISTISTNSDRIVQSQERSIYFGNGLEVEEDKENLYFIYGPSIIKYSLKTNIRTVLYSFDTQELNFSASSKDGIIYVYKNLTDASGKKYCQIYKYDVKNNKELPSIKIYTDAYGEDLHLSGLEIDGNGYMYFRYNNANSSLISFDKTGKFVDQLENANEDDYAMSLGVSYDNKVIYFTLPNLWRNNYGYVRINNGKFVDRKFWISDVASSWRYSENGEYAVDHIGNVIKLYYDDTSSIGFKYSVITYTGRGLEDYQPCGVFDGDYLYALGKNNAIIYKINLKTEKIEGSYKLQDSTLEGRSFCRMKVSDGKLYIVLEDYLNGYNNYYQIVIKDLNTDLNEITTIDITEHEAQTHSKESIIEKSKEAKAKFNYDNSIYNVEPKYDKAPYVAGSLKDQVVQDTLNQLNFYRWLVGLNTVSLNEQYMERSQKGAVIMARLKELTHTPDKPSDMDTDWYNEAYAGVNAGYDYSGNVSMGVRIDKTPLGFILDTNNVEPNVGHRSSMLDPTSDKTSFGYCNRYAAMSMYTTSADLGNDDAWYSWPSPGYFPVENMSTAMLWSIQVDPKYDFYSGGKGMSLTLTSGDNKKYNISLSELGYDSYYNNFYFKVPSGLLEYLTDGGNSYKAGKTVTVDFCGLTDEEFNTVNIHYTTEFFEPPYTLGDVNNDGRINASDARLVLLYFAERETLTETQQLAADVNFDGRINASDARKILLYFAEKITEF